MIKYRDHSSYEKRIEPLMDFKNLKELFDFVANGLQCHVREILITYYGFDERFNSELFDVRHEETGIIGFIYQDKK